MTYLPTPSHVFVAREVLIQNAQAGRYIGLCFVFSKAAPFLPQDDYVDSYVWLPRLLIELGYPTPRDSDYFWPLDYFGYRARLEAIDKIIFNITWPA